MRERGSVKTKLVGEQEHLMHADNTTSNKQPSFTTSLQSLKQGSLWPSLDQSFYQNLFCANTDLFIPLDKDKKRRRKESDGSEEAEVESDSLQVIQSLKSKGGESSFHLIVGDIKHLLHGFCNVFLSFTKRKYGIDSGVPCTLGKPRNTHPLPIKRIVAVAPILERGEKMLSS
nr:uncharacterized protein LOC109186242 [Ipomoea batatas]